MTVGPVERNMLARIKGGSHVIAGLIENRGQIGIEKYIYIYIEREREYELDHKKLQRKIERNLGLIFL
jgi:hypothetical protein